jgi:hypothetical protein
MHTPQHTVISITTILCPRVHQLHIAASTTQESEGCVTGGGPLVSPETYTRCPSINCYDIPRLYSVTRTKDKDLVTKYAKKTQKSDQQPN